MSVEKISSEKRRKLKMLAKLMNKQNERFLPIVRPLLEMLNLVLTSEELDYLLLMGTAPQTYEQAASLSTLLEDQFESLFETLQKKGFISIRYTENGEERYILNAILVGWIEGQVPYLMGRPKEKEFATKLFGEYISYGKKFIYFFLRDLQNAILRSALKPNQSVGIVESSEDARKKTVIDVNRTISAPDSKIYPTRTVNDLIEEYGNKNAIAQFPCMCRHSYSLLNNPCRFKMPDNGGCLGFGDFVKPYAKYGHCRYISKGEALDVIQEVREKGAIHSVFHKRDNTSLPVVGLCNCCWDCCAILRSYNMGAAALKYSCYYSARIRDSSLCTGCRECEKHCPTTAASVVDKQVAIDTKKCIGCGQCIHQCPKNVLELIPNERTVFLPILKKTEIRINV